MAGQAVTAAPNSSNSSEPKSAAANSSPGQVSQAYVIAPDDLLQVYILDVPELSREYRVSMSGQVAFPLLSKPLMAAGLTLDEFSQSLADQLRSSGNVSNPHIDISVKESRLHSVSITGSVKSPQIYPVLGRTKLLAVLSQAGGLAEG
ncbi:MAG TPA: polysaccharide biosynthesis/export family protein, partial [Terriglobales bacterium]